MHRFRKKSESKPSYPPDSYYDHPVALTQSQHSEHDALPSLPPASDFRTSLILPDLTRRFSVLRNSSGEPIGLEDLKFKFAEQRRRGSVYQVSEEEEDMILEALGRIHAKARSRSSSNEQGRDGRIDAHSVTTSIGSDLQSSTSTTSLSSAKGSQYSRRMSNNLFGSGKFRDYTYIRGQRRTEASRSSTATQSDSVASINTITSSKAPNGTSFYSDNQSLRPMTPDGSAYSPSNSVTSSPNGQADMSESATDDSSFGTRLSKTFSPDHVKNVSLALDEVIRELEEEDDDEIIMERSPIARVASTVGNILEPELSDGSPQPSPSDYEAGTALSSDVPVMSDDGHRVSPYPRSRTTSPTPRLPGYIPGMPRPMTPHDVSIDSDDQTPSATPRATSPRLPAAFAPASPNVSQGIVATLHRSNSTASTARQQTPRPTSPSTLPTSTSTLFLSRTTNGRFTPEDLTRNTNNSPAPESQDSTMSPRRRPNSPLSGPAFQPLVNIQTSRPSTPSTINWNTSSSPARTHQSTAAGLRDSHSRNGSIISIGVAAVDNSNDQAGPKSPAMSTYPSVSEPLWVNNGYQDGNPLGLYSTEIRAPSVISNIDASLSGRPSSRAARSPTPTYSPTSPTFSENNSPPVAGNGVATSRHSSRQATHGSFSLGSTHALLLSPIANSSRSSLESAGSSYHSWDEDHKKDRLFTLLSHLDSAQAEWHDVVLPINDKSSSSTSGNGATPYDSTAESEVIVKHEIGLSKSDFTIIQEKLVTAALAKAATPEGRHRAPSLRKRRPSTSQSNYSVNGGDSRVASPAPQTQPTVSAPPLSSNSDTITKASALLDSVVDSIQSPKPDTLLPSAPSTSPNAQPTNPSPTARHRALADALFGVENRDRQEGAHDLSSLPTTCMPEVVKRQPSSSPPGAGTPVLLATIPPLQSQPEQIPSQTPEGDGTDPNQLVVEVQRRAEAATLALRKPPTNHKAIEHSGSTRRRISPNQISSPTLMSASTSVDTIPLRTAAPLSQPQQPQPAQATQSTPSTFGSRLKKLRGTLRSKAHMVPSDGTTPYSSDSRTLASTQTLISTQSHLSPHGEFSPPVSPDLRRHENATVQSPASAGPSFRGFMSRFRKNRADLTTFDRQTQATPSTVSLLSPPPNGSAPHAHSAPATKSAFSTPHSLSPPPQPTALEADDVDTSQDTASQSEALRQLFNAANNLGLDRAALNDLIARSSTTSSHSSTWAKLTRNLSNGEAKDHRPPTRSSALTESRPSVDTLARPSLETRQLNLRKNSYPQPTRVRQEHEDPATNLVVCRTIILPSDPRLSNVDWNNLNRRPSTSRRRSGSGTPPHPRGTVQDRAPTPPPHRSAIGKRFSNDVSPPLPSLLPAFAPQSGRTSTSQIEKSSSAYDSLYEVHAGENRGGGTPSADLHRASGSQVYSTEGNGEHTTAVEVVELANGETIWSIVNGLRDDDVESYFGDRTSFASEFSAKEDGVKVVFREHNRKSSKGSSSSFLSRRKQPSQSASRPETKVFYGSSAQISRLIDNISRGMDSGTFSIAPDRMRGHAGHSASSSVGSEADIRWTVEERLEHMLGSTAADP